MTGFYFLRRHICKILIRENRYGRLSGRLENPVRRRAAKSVRQD